MSGYVVGFDAIRTNIPLLPKGAQVYAGYSTGSGVVPWTEADFAAHATALGPCLRIDQDPAASDPTADYLDVENGAATVADAPGWAKRALAAHAAGTRPGQRSPAIYMSASNVTPVVNSLIAGGVKSGIGLIVANWSVTETQAVSEVLAASGPFPVAGIQFADPGAYDVNVFSKAWLASMSGHWEPAAPVPAAPAQPATVPSGMHPVTVTLPELAQGASDSHLPHWYVRRAQLLLGIFGFRLAEDGVFGRRRKARWPASRRGRACPSQGNSTRRRGRCSWPGSSPSPVVPFLLGFIAGMLAMAYLSRKLPLSRPPWRVSSRPRAHRAGPFACPAPLKGTPMAGRVYTATTNLVAYTGTSATPILYGAAPATATLDIQAIRIGIYSGSGVSYPSNGSVLCQLARVTGTVGGGTSITARIAPHNASDIASNISALDDASGAAITGLTQGVNLWQQSLPFTAGANWAEWVTPGTEWRISASGLFALYLTASSAGTATDFAAEVVWTE